MAQMMLVVAAAITIMMLINGITAATKFTVGDVMGWTVPPASSPDIYSSWATKHNFAVGDTLVFQFPKGFHDVAEVSKDAYDECDAGDAEVHTDGPVDIPLDRAGSYFFICTFGNGGHCENGQKLAINVTSDAASLTPAASPTPEPVQSPSDEGSSPPMLLTSTFSVLFIAFVMDLLH